jgi:tRNA (Thr-GGU) A37 N-methylase
VYLVRPVGRVESSLVDREAAPKQGDEGAPEAWLVFEDAVREALADLQVGTDVILLTWLDRARREVLTVHPRGDPARPVQGVFSTRSPDRPNPIGLHRVTILAIDLPAVGRTVMPIHSGGIPVPGRRVRVSLAAALHGAAANASRESGPPVSVDLAPIIAATVRWLVGAYPTDGGVLSATLAEQQARQAVTVSAWLRYPSRLDAALVVLVGPGGCGRMDRLFSVDLEGRHDLDDAWRTWVDEVVASWAACLLGDRVLAAAAVDAVSHTEHLSGLACDFRRLTAPDERDRAGVALLRHPDLLAPVADLHRAQLLQRLHTDPVAAGS